MSQRLGGQDHAPAILKAAAGFLARQVDPRLPSYAAISRRPSARQLSDARLKPVIARVRRDNFGVDGLENAWRQLNHKATT